MIAIRLFLCLILSFAFVAFANADDAPEPSVRYQVTGVASGDTLNVRAQPGTEADVIGVLGPNAGNVIVTGSGWKIGTSTWWELVFPGTERGLGWVNGRFLTRQTDSPEETNYALNCGGTEPFWSLAVSNGQAQFKLWMEEQEQSLEASPWLQARGLRGWFVVRLAEAGGTNTADGFIAVRSAHQSFCSDDMSDTDYPFFATLILPNDEVFGGCCSRGAP